MFLSFGAAFLKVGSFHLNEQQGVFAETDKCFLEMY